MEHIQYHRAMENLPVAELIGSLREFLEPILMHLPEKRLREVAPLAVQGIIGAKSPVVTRMARSLAGEDETIWPLARRLYRFIWNERFGHRELLKGLYGVAQCTVAEHAPPYLVVALDPVNFEKPYTEKLEGVLYIGDVIDEAGCGRRETDTADRLCLDHQRWSLSWVAVSVRSIPRTVERATQEPASCKTGGTPQAQE